MITQADTLDYCKTLPDGFFDLSFCSPPYEDARTYGIGFSLKGEEWVKWAADRFVEQYRVTKGLTCWVIEGRTKKFQWTATPVLLMAELHRRGVKLRKPPIYHRVGIPGSGGPDYLRNDYEFIVTASHGKLPWSDNTACGAPCVYPVGGAMSNRNEDGKRINEETCVAKVKARRKAEGKMAESAIEPKAVAFLNGELPPGSKLHTKNNGSSMRVQCYTPPAIANPGNVISASVGGGRMGSKLSHENEAPFPESLVEFFIKSFCPPGGKVYDGFCGSGTTPAVAKRLGREFYGTDIRESQVELTGRRLNEN